MTEITSADCRKTCLAISKAILMLRAAHSTQKVSVPRRFLGYITFYDLRRTTAVTPYTVRENTDYPEGLRPTAAVTSPSGGLDDRHIHPGNVRPAAVERLEHNNRIFQLSPSRGGSGYSCLQVHMTLHRNPIRHNAYKLIVYASDPGSSRGETFRQAFSGRTGRASGAMLFTYRITLGHSPEHRLSWTRTSVVTTLSQLTLPLSYAGYTLNRGGDGAMRIVDLRPTPRFPLKWGGPRIREGVVISREGNERSLSSTGGIFISTPNEIEISYYA
ncbi:hypothetical protein DFH08DRAFT_803386 [Mycena albidolilacea]|uniref:Uncharacterized protein n=1 Tax=Mycena albidolilacea TaxID=1033008 RepID=A0AAD7ACS0_9AGAR|nr:hypothetical protein DFH08DRAFT_803386 [Mycena albidolilacea]